ncbi:FG-GAP-like repeat-containing protein [Streptomyces sp. NPDC026092]|uniref:FG-GAP-like repeat-containing protein n=1 Tax=Streptomyces sp. NPDC026092 TaxID=3154797 RepID=UPI0033E47A2D
MALGIGRRAERRGWAAGGLLGVGAVAVSLLTAPQTVADEAPVPPKTELRVISWNICGEAGGARGTEGYCARRNEPAAKSKAIASLTRQHQADVLLLQEACGYGDGTVSGDQSRSHLATLESELGPEGWYFTFAKGNREGEDENVAGNGRCRGSDFGGDLGVILGVKGTLKDTQRFDTLPDVPRKLSAVCGRLEGWPDKLCSTHLLPGGGTAIETAREGQAKEIVKQLNADLPAGVVVAGDLNAAETSASLKPFFDAGLYRSASTEYTRQGWAPGVAAPAPSTSRIDHVFTSKRNRFTSIEVAHDLMDRTKNVPNSQPNGWSDHAPVIATLAPAYGDLTGDTRPDLLAVEKAGGLRLYPGDGTGDHTAPNTAFGAGTDWTGASVTHRGDWTGDGREDVVARVGTELRLYPNKGGSALDTSRLLTATPLAADATVTGVGDITGDGYPDLVVNQGDKLYRYDGVPGNAPSVKAPLVIGEQSWTPMEVSAAGDADQDGFPDFFARNKVTNELFLYRGNDGRKDASGVVISPLGRFDERITYGTGYGTANRPLLAGAHDANGDGTADLWATAVDSSGTYNLLFYAGGVSGGKPVDGPATVVGAGGWSIFSSLS